MATGEKSLAQAPYAVLFTSSASPSDWAATQRGVVAEAGAAVSALQPYLETGDAVVKTVSCHRHYSFVLLASGSLVILAPAAPGLHGRRVPCGGERVVDVGAGATHVVFCTASGAVYSFGWGNRYGQLGDGTVWDAWPEGVAGMEASLMEASVMEAAAPAAEDEAAVSTPAPQHAAAAAPRLSGPRRIPGFGHLPAPAEDGAAIAADSRPETGSPPTESRAACEEVVEDASSAAPDCPAGEAAAETGFPTPRAAPVLIGAVACGVQHTLLLTARLNGVYGCGRGHCGQLGGRRPLPLQPVFRSIQLLFGLPLRQLAAAGDHSFALLRTGKLLAFGANACGQLGLGHTRDVLTPTPVVFDGDVFPGVGGPRPPEGELGKGGGRAEPGKRKPVLDSKTRLSLRAPYASVESSYFPLRIERISEEVEPGSTLIRHVWCCDTLSIVLTSEGEWLSCGMNHSRSWRVDMHSRYDAYGVLGRPLTSFQMAWVFGRMHWGPSIRSALDRACEGAPDSAEGRSSVACACYSHMVLARIVQRAEATEASKRPPCTLVVQCDVQRPLLDVYRRDSLTEECGDFPYRVEVHHPTVGGGARGKEKLLLGGATGSTGAPPRLATGTAESAMDDDSTTFEGVSTRALLTLRDCVVALE